MFKNMKIAVNEQQPLDEVLRVIRARGCRIGEHFNESPTHVVTTGGVYTVANISGRCQMGYVLIPLAELNGGGAQ